MYYIIRADIMYRQLNVNSVSTVKSGDTVFIIIKINQIATHA